MIKKTNKQIDPFKNLILDDYEKELEASLAEGEWKRVDNFIKRKKGVEQAARDALELRKSKRITFRINQGDLVRLKTRADQKSIPYQTLLGALIRDYVEGIYTIKL